MFEFIKRLWRGNQPILPDRTVPTPAPISPDMQAAYRNARGRVDRIGAGAITSATEKLPGTAPSVPTTGLSPQHNHASDIHTIVRDMARTSEPSGVAVKSSQINSVRPARIFPDYGAKLTEPVAPPVKHPEAVYRDETGQKTTISYRALISDQVFLDARRHDLFTPDESQRLQVRHGPGIRHFWCPSDDGHFLASSKAQISGQEDQRETDPRHEQRIEYLVVEAARAQPTRLITIDFEAYRAKYPAKGSGAGLDITTLVEVDQFTLADLKGYGWKPNTRHHKLGETTVCPDIIGKLPGTKATERNPAVFVEVVNTHFPSENTWQAYRQQTAEKPLIVVFDFMQNYHFEVRHKALTKHRAQGDVRAIYYLWKGGVFENTRRLDKPNSDYTSKMFEDLLRLKLRKLHKPGPKSEPK